MIASRSPLLRSGLPVALVENIRRISSSSTPVGSDVIDRSIPVGDHSDVFF